MRFFGVVELHPPLTNHQHRQHMGFRGAKVCQMGMETIPAGRFFLILEVVAQWVADGCDGKWLANFFEASTSSNPHRLAGITTDTFDLASFLSRPVYLHDLVRPRRRRPLLPAADSELVES